MSEPENLSGVIAVVEHDDGTWHWETRGGGPGSIHDGTWTNHRQTLAAAKRYAAHIGWPVRVYRCTAQLELL